MPDEQAHITVEPADRVHFIAKTLHEQMMLEAEHLIQHNWLDVVVHDKRKLRSIPVDHAFFWVVRPEGSSLLPAYCKLSDRVKYCWGCNDRKFHPIESIAARCEGNVRRFPGKFDPDSYGYYSVVKRREGGEITKLSFAEFGSIASSGVFAWVDNTFKKVKDKLPWV